jgi:Lon protease-like protein
MAAELLPLFPLSLVLVPSMPLPLHIFEDRYKEMMGEIIPNRAEFGIVLAKDGGIVNVGCSAIVDQVLRRYPDGRLDLIAVGQRRFTLTSLDEERAFLRGGVEFFNDEDTREVSPELRNKAMAAFHLLTTIEEEEEIDATELQTARLSFRMARLVSDLDKRQTILTIRSEIERLEYLLKIVPEYVARQARIAAAKRVAPSNGHVAGQA